MGRFGQKTWRAGTRYDEKRRPMPDPEVAAFGGNGARKQASRNARFLSERWSTAASTPW